MQKELKNITNTIREQMEFLRSKYHVKKIDVFGSVARGEETETSDIDMLVEFSKSNGMFAFLELEEYLGSLLKKKVDLVTKQSLKSIIRDQILRETVYA